MHAAQIGPPRALIDDPTAAAETLRRFLSTHQPLVLTGAGISVASGLPAYRDKNGDWQHTQPMQHREFAELARARQRYWSRAMLGWELFSKAAPSTIHKQLTDLQAQRRIGLIATQNVDGLHQRAGSKEVLDIHGRLDQVICLDCGDQSARGLMQTRLNAANPGWQAQTTTANRPDGDTELAANDDHFVVPACRHCGGRLKPHVVFYGDTVPVSRVERLSSALAQARSLLVIGSSLMVYSGYRVARWASEAAYPIVLVNEGITRADPIADVRLAVDAQEICSALSLDPLQ